MLINNNLIALQHLNLLDLANKFNIISIYNIPRCFKICLNINYRSIISGIIDNKNYFFICFVFFNAIPSFRLLPGKVKNKKRKCLKIFLNIPKKNLLSFFHFCLLKNKKIINPSIKYTLTRQKCMVSTFFSYLHFFYDLKIMFFSPIHFTFYILFFFNSIKFFNFKNFICGIKNFYFLWKF